MVAVEPRAGGKEAMAELMDDYAEAIASGAGALLVAVFRGKVSEGIDFKDDMARAVVAVGIPFPQALDPKVTFKKRYNTERARAQGDCMTGDEWYEATAYRALNQALGRCIRHPRDWGAVLLVDSRWGVGARHAYLPRWLRDRHPVVAPAQDMRGILATFQGAAAKAVACLDAAA